MNFQSAQLFSVAAISLKHEKRDVRRVLGHFGSFLKSLTSGWKQCCFQLVPEVHVCGMGIYQHVVYISFFYLCKCVILFCKSFSLEKVISLCENAVGTPPPPQPRLDEDKARGGQLTSVRVHLQVVLRSGAVRLLSAKGCHFHLRHPAGQHHGCPHSRERASSGFLRGSLHTSDHRSLCSIFLYTGKCR